MDLTCGMCPLWMLSGADKPMCIASLYVASIEVQAFSNTKELRERLLGIRFCVASWDLKM